MLYPYCTRAVPQYGINPHGYMTGFFASRPALKRYVRSASGFYQASKQLNVLAYGDASALTQFADAMGIAQHHDAGGSSSGGVAVGPWAAASLITPCRLCSLPSTPPPSVAVSGSSKQHVAFDYALRISKGSADGAKVVASGLETLVTAPAPMTWCPDANVSLCVGSATLPFVVVPYNPLPRSVSTVVRIPVATAGVEVTSANGTVVPSQVRPSDPYDLGACCHGPQLLAAPLSTAVVSSAPVLDMQDKVQGVGGAVVLAVVCLACLALPPPPSVADLPAHGGLPYSVVFAADLPPLGFNTYFVSASPGQGEPAVQGDATGTQQLPQTVKVKCVTVSP